MFTFRSIYFYRNLRMKSSIKSELNQILSLINNKLENFKCLFLALSLSLFLCWTIFLFFPFSLSFFLFSLSFYYFIFSFLSELYKFTPHPMFNIFSGSTKQICNIPIKHKNFTELIKKFGIAGGRWLHSKKYFFKKLEIN